MGIPTSGNEWIKGLQGSMRLETINVQKHQFTSLKGTKEIDGGTEPELELCRAIVAKVQWDVAEEKRIYRSENLDHRSRKKTVRGKKRNQRTGHLDDVQGWAWGEQSRKKPGGCGQGEGYLVI